MKYKHKKSGVVYELLHIANECNTAELPKMAVYKSMDDGAIYARYYSDFKARFEQFDHDCDGSVCDSCLRNSVYGVSK